MSRNRKNVRISQSAARTGETLEEAGLGTFMRVGLRTSGIMTGN